MSRGKRADAEAKLNVKKIIGLIVAIVVVILFIASMFNGIKKVLFSLSRRKMGRN